MTDKEWDTLQEWAAKDPKNRSVGRMLWGRKVHAWYHYEKNNLYSGTVCSEVYYHYSVHNDDEDNKGRSACKKCILLIENGA